MSIAQSGPFQASANAGELAPSLYGRTDVKQYYAGASVMRNVEPVPQGGFRLAARPVHRGQVRQVLSSSVLMSGTATAAATAGADVVATLNFAPSFICAAQAYFSGSIARAAGLQFEYLESDSGTWKTLGPAFDIATTGRTRRVGTDPGTTVKASGIRLRLAYGGAALALTYGDVLVFLETGATYPPRVIPFTFSRTQAYVAVLTPYHVDFWRDGAFVGCAELAYGAGELEAADYVQRFDTMILTHPGYPERRIMRRGADHEWNVDLVPFTNIPIVDLGGTYTQVAARYLVRINWNTTESPTGSSIVFTVDGEATTNVTLGGTTAAPDWAAFGPAIKAAIEALATVDAGITVSISTAAGTAAVYITFTGGTNPGRPFVMSAKETVSAATTVAATETRRGKPGGEALMSAARGYSRCAAFYQDRLWLGGQAGKGNALLASVTGDYFNENIEMQLADGAILVALDTDGAEVVQKIVKARYLVIFTSEAEYFISERAISRLTPPNTVECSRNGSHPNIAILEAEGSLLYVSADGSLIYRATYSDISQAYDSEVISLLASHIVKGIKAAAMQRANDDSDANRYWLVRDDGTMTCGVLIKGQDVIAFVRWETDGAVSSVAVDGSNRPFITVLRPGQAHYSLEELVVGGELDGEVTINQAPATVVPGLAMHEGAAVWAKADGYMLGPFTVAGGAITLPIAASSITVGRWMPPRFRTMPILRQVAERVVAARPVRVHTVRVDVADTTSIAIGANGQAAEEIRLARFGDPANAPTPAFSGRVVAEGLVGYSDEGFVEITQTRPGALRVSGLSYEAKG